MDFHLARTSANVARLTQLTLQKGNGRNASQVWDIFVRLFNRSLVAIMLHQFLFYEAAANLTLLFILVRVGGVILASWQHRKNLVKAMFTGHEKAD